MIFCKRVKVRCLHWPNTVHDSVIVRCSTSDGVVHYAFVTCDLERAGDDTCMRCRKRIAELYDNREFTDGIICP